MLAKQSVFEPSQLLSSAEADQFFGNWTLGTSQRGNDIARGNHHAAQYPGCLGHLICHSKHLPQRMAAQNIILPAQVKLVAQRPVFAGAHLAVMVEFLGETARLPAPHAGGKNSDVVDAAPANRNIATDLLEALAAKQLARSGNVFNAN